MQGVGYGPYGVLNVISQVAMAYMNAGEHEFGLEIVRRFYSNIIKRGLSWDAPNILRGDKDTGEVVFGHDYYFNMMLWMLPAAMEEKDMSNPTKPGRLIHRIIQAARCEGP